MQLEQYSETHSEILWHDLRASISLSPPTHDFQPLVSQVYAAWGTGNDWFFWEPNHTQNNFKCLEILFVLLVGKRNLIQNPYLPGSRVPVYFQSTTQTTLTIYWEHKALRHGPDCRRVNQLKSTYRLWQSSSNSVSKQTVAKPKIRGVLQWLGQRARLQKCCSDYILWREGPPSPLPPEMSEWNKLMGH